MFCSFCSCCWQICCVDGLALSGGTLYVITSSILICINNTQTTNKIRRFFQSARNQWHCPSNFRLPHNDFDVGARTRSDRRILADDFAALRDHHAAVQLDARVLQQRALRIAQRLAFVPAHRRGKFGLALNVYLCSVVKTQHAENH